MQLATLLLVLAPIVSSQLEPNVCNTFLDYYTMNPNHCWHNPDVYLDPSDIVKRHGYPLEVYEVETEDHYLLDLYRMPKSNPKGVVLLESPAFTTYCGWIDKGTDDSLGFLLWDAGYDVWLGNVRGTTFARKHKFLNPNEKPYWNFSFHEIGIYDIPAQVDLIVEKTGLKPGSLSIISFSLGSTANVVYSAMRPEHSGKWVNIFALMAPSSILLNIDQIIKDYCKNSYEFFRKLETQFTGEIMANNRFIHSFLGVCRSAPIMAICLINDLLLMGNAAEEQPPLSIRDDSSYTTMGNETNFEYYGSELPPAYPIGDVQVPMLLISADLDPISTTADVEILFSKLPKNAQIYKPLIIKDFSHGAFFYGKNAAIKVYKPIIKILNGIYES